MAWCKNEVFKRSYDCNKSTRNAVKSLVLEFENVLSHVNGDVTRMGSDQSVVKSIPTNQGLVKQRIDKLNQIEKEFRRSKRSLSTYDGKISQNADFQRSKSVETLKKFDDSVLVSAKENMFGDNSVRKSVYKQNKTSTIDRKRNKKYSNRKSDSFRKTDTKQDSFQDVVANNNAEDVFEKSQNEAHKDLDQVDFDKEFEFIEHQLQDASKTLCELVDGNSEPVFVSTVNNFVITNNKNKTRRDEKIVCDNRDSIENIDLYLHQQESFDSDNEFGEVSKEDLKDVEFVEAYNQSGHELLMTTIHSVTETFLEEEAVGKNEDQVQTGVFEVDVLDGVDNRLYFSKEELETLVPDNDDEVNSTTPVYQNSLQNFLEDTVDKETVQAGEITLRNTYLDAITSETTIYDSFQNPRIAKVRSINVREDFSKNNFMDENHDIQKHLEYKPKIDYIIEELVDTERRYIDYLECILEDYMPYFKSNNLAPRSVIRTLFGNIRDIYQLTQKLYRTLKECSDYEGVAKTFLRYEPLFEMYPIYFKNKPRADYYLLGEFREILMIRERELNDQLGLASHLLTPIQRLGKYILFLKQIKKELNKNDLDSDLVVMALNMLKREMTTGNDYIAVDSIKKSPIPLVQQGSFVMREKFKMLKPKKYEAVIFFFEKIIVFTTVHPKNSELFIYKDSIKLDEMGIVTYDDEPLLIHLKRFPSGNMKDSDEQNRYVVEAKREKDKKVWTDEIEKRLWDQLIKCRERQLLLHNCAKKKHLFESTPDSTKKKKAGHRSLPTDFEKNVKKRSTFYLE